MPFLLRKHVKRTAGNYSTFDAGRGCPYQCSFCTIINVQGRKSRRRSPDDVEHIIRQNWAEGIHRFFITDDNLARNKDWEPILDRIIKLRAEEGISVNLMIQVDTLCHKIPNFIEKCAKAGVNRVFIGMESVNPDTLIAAKKRQNKITEYRKLLLAWKAVGAVTYAGYILGFPNDTPESIRRDIAIVQRELPIDMMEFFCLTPLPGSEDHQILYRKGVAMDPDMNKYDTEHAVTAHPKMTKARMGGDLSRRLGHLLHAGASGTHHASGRRDRHQSQLTRRDAAAFLPIHRDGECPPAAGRHLPAEISPRSPARRFAIEPMWAFYPKYLWDTAGKLVRAARAARHSMAWRRRSRPTRGRRPIWTKPWRRPSRKTWTPWSCSTRTTRRAMPCCMSDTCAS